MPKSKGGFYAVQKGRKSAIFTSWAECEANVRGFTGAVYKKFDSRADAEAFVSSQTGYQSSSSTTPSAAGTARKRSRDNSVVSTCSTSSSSFKRVKGESGTASNPTFPRPPTSSLSSSNVKTINVYVDGSGLGNGTSTSRAGWGVYWEDESLHGLNEARRLPGPIQTNNRGELMAMIRAIQLCPDPDAQLVIHTDSQYSVDCVEKWIQGWRRKGWLNSTGKDVMNRDLVRRLDREMASCKLRPKLSKVAAHSGVYGNEMADQLAKHGAALPEEFGEDLEPPHSDEERGTGPVSVAVAVGTGVALGRGGGKMVSPFSRAGSGVTAGKVVHTSDGSRRENKVDPSDELDGLGEDAFISPEELKELEGSY